MMYMIMAFPLKSKHQLKSFILIGYICKVIGMEKWVNNTQRLEMSYPSCEKHSLGRGHTPVAPGSEVVAHFGPPCLHQRE